MEKFTIAQTGSASASELVETQLTDGTEVTVILANHPVKMNNLKVTLSTAGDSARDEILIAWQRHI